MKSLTGSHPEAGARKDKNYNEGQEQNKSSDHYVTLHQFSEESKMLNRVSQDDWQAMLNYPEVQRALLESYNNLHTIKNTSIQNSVEPKKFNTVAFKTDIENFKSSIHAKKELEFLDKFIEDHRQHDVSSKSDAYSLLLNSAILFEEIDLINHILGSADNKDNILTSNDEKGSSPLSQLLHSENPKVWSLVDSYIEKVSSTLEKTNLTDTVNITFLVKHPPSFGDMTSVDCFRDFVCPLYSEESLKDVAQAIGLTSVEDAYAYDYA